MPVPSTAAAADRTSTLLERESEVAAFDDALRRVAEGSGAAIIVAGAPGIGASSLLRVAGQRAAERGIRVLRARGGELEHALPYGVVMELFGGIARDRVAAASLFAGPARIAERLLAGGGSDRGTSGREPVEPVDPVANVHGLFWLVLNMVEEAPLAIIVDDAQWADEPSLRFLNRLLDRIGELPVAVFLGMGPHAQGDMGTPLDRVRHHRSAVLLEPRPLSEHAVGRLVSDVTHRSIEVDLRRTIARATGGNPFFVSELANDLARLDPEALDPARVAMYLPERVGRYVEARLIGIAPEARTLAEAVAILGDRATLDRAGRLADLDPAAAAAAARQLVDARILVDTPVLTFGQPMVSSAIDARLPAPVRAEMLRRAALILADDGAESDIVGAMLREAAPTGDRRVVELLVAAAADAVDRGEPGTAATLLQRALAEPAAPEIRPDVLRRLARAEAAGGAPSAPSTFEDAIATIDDPRERAQLRLELGHSLISGGQWAGAAAAFGEGLAEAPVGDEELRRRLEAAYLAAAWISMRDRAEIGERITRILALDELGAANRELAVWMAFHHGAAIESSAPEMADLVRRVFAEAPIEELVHQGQVVEVGAGVLLETDELAFEMSVMTDAIDAARRTGPISKVGLYSYCRAWPSYYMGRLTEAIADIEEALRAGELGWEAFVPAAVTVGALAHIERDELDAARRVLDIDPDKWAGRIDTAMLVPLAAGRLALAAGDVDGALAQLRQAGEGAAAGFMRNTIPTEWRTWYAMALLQADRRDEARDVAAEAVDVARRWAARWPLGAALRISGRVTGGSTGLEQLHEAEDLLRDSPARLEYARLLMTLGVALRRNGTLTDARSVLSRAADLAQQIGARAILARATSELRAAGARPRRIALTGVASLTPAELRVATEALAGHTNREIAQALFVTPKAVEFHLANTYRKLGIDGRGHLAAAMAGGGDSGAP